jgi:hypothetical protein
LRTVSRSALTRAQAAAGINFIDDIDPLVEAGLIVPLSSATSRIVVVIRDAACLTLRRVVSRFRRPTSKSWHPLFWPESAPPAIVDTGIEIPPVDAGADGG